MNQHINRLSARFGHLVPRSTQGMFQFGVAAIRTIVILASLLMAGITLAIMTPSESGFAEGLVFIVYGVYALAGFVILAVGLLIPQRGDDGIHFTRTQRRLLAYGVVAPIVSVLAIPIGATVLPPLSDGATSLLVMGLIALILSGPLAILLAVGTKLRQ